MTEAKIQAQLIEWWSMAHKGLRVPDNRCLIMVPNGAYLGAGVKTLKDGRTVSLGALRFRNLKRQGFVNGTPDLFLAVPRIHQGRFYGGMWLEMKRPRGVTSDAQDEMQALLHQMGYAVDTAVGFDEGVNAIVNYLAGEPCRAERVLCST